jgi:hypothetical protein
MILRSLLIRIREKKKNARLADYEQGDIKDAGKNKKYRIFLRKFKEDG